MDPCHYSRIKLFTFSLPLFCLISWSLAAASTATPFLPPPTPALLAADILRSRGYSIFASIIVSLSTTATNFSGTILAPPDFAFSFAAIKFLNNRRPPPPPSISLLHYHTLRPPLILTWPTLSSRDDGDELRTLYKNNCLYLFRSSYGGEVSISSSPFKNPNSAVKIRQPDLYVDEHLTVHGIDGVLDPSFATKCHLPYVDPTADTIPRQVNRTFLDHAIRALRRTGYNVVAAAMAIRRTELLSLTSVTVFAVSDENLFLKTGGFRYDFRHHVVPVRHSFADLVKSMAGGMELETLAPNKNVVVYSFDGAVSVDGVAVDVTEVYRNRWIIVVSVTASLDDVVDSQWNPPIPGAFPVSVNLAPSPATFSGVSTDGNLPRVRYPATDCVGETKNGVASSAPVMPRVPSLETDNVGETKNGVPSSAPVMPRVASPATDYVGETKNGVPSSAPVIPRVPYVGKTKNGVPSSSLVMHRVLSPTTDYIGETENGVPSSAPANSPNGSADFSSVNSSSSPSPAPEIEAAPNSASSPAPSDDVSDTPCDWNAIVPGGLEGEDLFCPVNNVRQLGKTDSSSGAPVEESKPLDSYSQVKENLTQSDEVKIVENVNIADDVFFYI